MTTQLPIRKESILPRLDGITKNIQKLKELSLTPLSEFEQRGDSFDLAQHHLRLALEGVFHIGSHILSRLPGTRTTSYTDIARRLGEHGIVDPQYAQGTLVQMAGYRTRLTHFYHDVTPKELHEIISNRLTDIEVFLARIKAILQDPQSFGFHIE